MAPDRRALVRLSALLGRGDLSGIREALREACRAAGPRQVEEVLLQAYLFVGFPAVLEATAALRDLGPPEITEPEEEPDGDRALWRRRGEALCRRVYGRAYPKLRQNVRRLHPALDRWMLEEGYGKVLSRPGLDPAVRELAIVALLAAAGHEPQLHSHLRGALRVGASAGEVDEAVRIGAEHARTPGVAAGVRALWDRVRQEATGGSGTA